MKSILEVCLVSLGLISVTMGQTAATPSISTPTLRKGISVQMAVTEHAITEPEADKEDALVAVMTKNGTLYLITDPMTTSTLAKRIKDELQHSPDKKVYLKADARTPYAVVLRILRTVQGAGVTAPVLLASQGQPRQSEQPVVPEGIPVLLGPAPTGGEPPAVQLLKSGLEHPSAKVAGKEVSWANLQSAIEQVSQHSAGKTVVLSADGQLPFANIVHVVDVCRAAGIQVIL